MKKVGKGGVDAIFLLPYCKSAATIAGHSSQCGEGGGEIAAIFCDWKSGGSNSRTLLTMWRKGRWPQIEIRGNNSKTLVTMWRRVGNGNVLRLEISDSNGKTLMDWDIFHGANIFAVFLYFLCLYLFPFYRWDKTYT